MFTFQSTLPVRGATRLTNSEMHTYTISIHAPRAGSDAHRIRRLPRCVISIHAPRAGSDDLVRHVAGISNGISIHAPRAGSDERRQRQMHGMDISIHAPRAGSDQGLTPHANTTLHFNPRSPCGERRQSNPLQTMPNTFQSTLPVRGATRVVG